MKKVLNKIIKNDNFSELQIFDLKDKLKAIIMIDNDDIEKISCYNWCFNNGYARCNNYGDMLFLHRYIMNCPEGMTVDHVNHNTKDNRKYNLRICTYQENNINTSIRQGKNLINGVIKDKRCNNSWMSRIYVGNIILTKSFKNENDAILQRFIWELNYFRDYSPQLSLIKNKYPHLLHILKLNKFNINYNIERVKEVLSELKDSPYCPCMVVQNTNTICPCLPCRTKNVCICKLFINKISAKKEKEIIGYSPYTKVRCITTKKEFNSIKEAKDFYNIPNAQISFCCQGKRKSAGKLEDGTKLVWEYIKENIKED